MPHEVVYVQASAAEPNNAEIAGICRKMESEGFSLLHVAPAQVEGGVTAGLWLFFSDEAVAPATLQHLEAGGSVIAFHSEPEQPLTFAGEGGQGTASTMWREVRSKKGLGASLTVTGLAAVILGIVLHFALRSDLIGTALHLGYFFGVVGLFLFLIGLLIVF